MYFQKILALTCAAVSMTACTKTQFAYESEAQKNQRYVNEVLKMCADYRAAGKLTKTTQTITFADPATEVSGTVCKWNEGDNGPMGSGIAGARHEQLQAVDLDNSYLICGVDLNFPTQEFQYDDHFLFTLNNKVIATSSANLLSYLPSRTTSINGQSMTVYDYGWDFIRGQKVAGNTAANDYCVGEGSMSSCNWPISEASGSISMDMDPNLVAAMANNFNEAGSGLDLGFITTGDDNPSSDCQHKPITFTVEVEYIKSVPMP